MDEENAPQEEEQQTETQGEEQPQEEPQEQAQQDDLRTAELEERVVALESAVSEVTALLETLSVERENGQEQEDNVGAETEEDSEFGDSFDLDQVEQLLGV